MQTDIIDRFKTTVQGQEADAILRSCVHCGFCNATCPTYQLLGDELDGPRGRIYLIKQVLEGAAPTARTQLHLDRCLTCRACETTCPSGVSYGRLLDIGRERVEAEVPRTLLDRLRRRLLRMLIPHRARFELLIRTGRVFRPLLTKAVQRVLPESETTKAWPELHHARRMLVLEGCVQPALAPNINVAAARVLDRLGVSLLRVATAGCCGALSQHLSAEEEAKAYARRNIDAWWPYIEPGDNSAGVQVLVITASGCGVFVKDYAHLLRDDPDYAARAARVAALAKDISEVLTGEDLASLRFKTAGPYKVAFQSPCTLQHGQQLNGVTEKLLIQLGFTLTAVPDAHLCCGSAGTYSILQKTLSQQLLTNKLTALQSASPDCIATANIGCLTHLQSRAAVPVRHWIELVDDACAGA